MNTKNPLTRTAWIQAAFRALTVGGPQAIKAEAIARDLKVSKGSFYWHFKDVGELKTAMIEHWQDVATQAVITALDRGDMPPREHLSRLMELATSQANAPFGGPLAEPAIRDWARYDQKVRAAVTTIDQQRILYVQELLEKLGKDENSASLNARILYAALIGLAQLSNLEGSNPQQDLLSLLYQIIGD